ncbi:MAG TPA: M20/M25/M40 family metallo-hydrolase [Anaerolineae bacterium]|nr:M20/M25/M40 family metallo-hydrolase [Anaerolineae bacterium]
MKVKALLLAIGLGLGGVWMCLAFPGAAQISTTPVLVRINLINADDLGRLAALEVPVYAHLTASTADYLLARLTPDEQKQVTGLGFSLTVLDPDATGASYYLLESDGVRPGTSVAAVNALFAILYDDGRHAVGRLRPGVALSSLDALGVRVKPLLDPIVLSSPATAAIPTTPFYDSLVADLLTRVTTETLTWYDGGLSGERAIEVGGAPYTLTTRYSYSGVPIAKATQYVYEHLQSLGYAVRYHTYTLSGYNLRNVIGEKPGRVHPEKIVLLTAHLDSRAAAAPHDPAPGADDNASGASALLVAADLLADMDFDYTIRLVFFTGEEQGMWGSYYYATEVYNAREAILGVLNFDMIAWDAKAGPDIDLHSNNPTVRDDSDALADLVAAVIDVYDLELIPQIVKNGTTFSDHSRFWDKGYAAILGIENYYNPAEQAAEPRDWNINYHTVNDRLATLNLTYFREYARAALAAFVHLADPLREISGTVMSQETVRLPLSATVTAVGQAGVFSASATLSGMYALEVPGGWYTVTAVMEGYFPQSFANVAVVTGTGVRLDFALTPIPMFTVTGNITDAASGEPLTAVVQINNGQIIHAPNGFYSATLYSGTHVLTVDAPFHWPVSRTVIVDREQRQDFALEPTPCLLVVDDDFDDKGQPYDDQAYYTQTLENLRIGYDLWPVPDDADGPPLDILRRYRGVIWLTGRDWDFTLTAVDQTALMAYLDGGGRLFVSGQDIGWDIARKESPPFYRDYLHAGFLRDASGFHELAGADFLDGITITIEGGDGANNQKFPSDIAVADGGMGVFRYTGDGDWAATAYADATYRVVYFAFGFEGINSAADRVRVMTRVLTYLQPCEMPSPPPPPPPYALSLEGDSWRVGLPGQTVIHTLSLKNTGTLSDAYDLTLGEAAWTTTLGLPWGTIVLPITRTSVLSPQERLTLALHVTIPPTAPFQAYDQVTVTATSVFSPVHSASTTRRTVVGSMVYLPLVLRNVR